MSEKDFIIIRSDWFLAIGIFIPLYFIIVKPGFDNSDYIYGLFGIIIYSLVITQLFYKTIIFDQNGVKLHRKFSVIRKNKIYEYSDIKRVRFDQGGMPYSKPLCRIDFKDGKFIQFSARNEEFVGDIIKYLDIHRVEVKSSDINLKY